MLSAVSDTHWGSWNVISEDKVLYSEPWEVQRLTRWERAWAFASHHAFLHFAGKQRLGLQVLAKRLGWVPRDWGWN